MKKKISSKTIAILSIGLVLLTTFGVFIGVQWRKASDVDVASDETEMSASFDGTKLYKPGYIPDPEMRCSKVYSTDLYPHILALTNLRWSPSYNTIEDYNDSYLSEGFPDANNLDSKSLIHIRFGYLSHLLTRLGDVQILQDKIDLAISKGVKIFLSGQARVQSEQASNFFKMFGLDIKQEPSSYSFPPEHQMKKVFLGDRLRGYVQKKADPNIKAIHNTVQPFYDIKNTEYEVIYETISDKKPVMIDFKVGSSGSIVRVNGDVILTTPFDDKTYYSGEGDNLNHAYEYTSRMFSCKNPEGIPDITVDPAPICADFETLPTNGNVPKDGLKISNQFESKGFKFSLKPTAANTTCPSTPQIAVKGGKATAFVGYGEASVRQDNPHPDNASSIGSYFLTDDGTISKSACQLNVAVEKDLKSTRIEFDIIDIDYRDKSKPERFNVIIKFGTDAKNLKSKTIKTPILDTQSKSYKVVVTANEPIRSLQIVPIGNVSTWGVAYDNFCSVK